MYGDGFFRNDMKILLVNPYCLSDSVTLPLGLAFLSSAVRDIAEVTIKDFIKEDLSKVSALEAVLEQGDYDLVGFKTLHANYMLVKRYLDMMKQQFPHITTVVGGPQASIMRSEMLELYQDTVDFVISGEGEISFRKLCLVLQQHHFKPETIPPEALSDISGLSAIADGQVINNPIELCDDIGQYRIDWDVLGPDTYPPLPHAAFARRFPVTSISVSRGCPYHCTFCAAFKIFGRRVRYRSADVVLDEMEYLIGKYRFKEFQVIDDNFSFDKRYVMEFCQKLLDRKLDILWSLPNGTRLDNLDDEMLDIMKRSGLYSLSVGIESGSERILKLMRKKLDLPRVPERLALIKRHGIEMAGFFIMGYHTETAEEILQTIQFALSIPLDRAQFMLFHPYPGTEAYEQVKDHLVYDADTTFAEVAYVPDTLTEKELKRLQRRSFLRFYLRPRILFKLVTDILRMRGKRYIIKRMIRWLS